MVLLCFRVFSPHVLCQTDNLSQVTGLLLHGSIHIFIHSTSLHVQQLFFVFFMSLDITHLRIIYVSSLDLRQCLLSQDKGKPSRRWHGNRFGEDTPDVQGLGLVQEYAV
jgi:hypothetical protein